VSKRKTLSGGKEAERISMIGWRGWSSSITKATIAHCLKNCYSNAFTIYYDSERVLFIGLHLPKLWQKVKCIGFLTHTVVCLNNQPICQYEPWGLPYSGWATEILWVTWLKPNTLHIHPNSLLNTVWISSPLLYACFYTWTTFPYDCLN